MPVVFSVVLRLSRTSITNKTANKNRKNAGIKETNKLIPILGQANKTKIAEKAHTAELIIEDLFASLPKRFLTYMNNPNDRNTKSNRIIDAITEAMIIKIKIQIPLIKLDSKAIPLLVGSIPVVAASILDAILEKIDIIVILPSITTKTA